LPLKLNSLIKVRENRRRNQVWTILRNWQDWVHKKQDKDKQNKNATQKTKNTSNMDHHQNTSTVTEKIATKNILDGWKDGRTDRGKTVYPLPLRGAGGIITIK
jgi:hypothetical protein